MAGDWLDSLQALFRIADSGTLRVHAQPGYAVVKLRVFGKRIKRISTSLPDAVDFTLDAARHQCASEMARLLKGIRVVKARQGEEVVEWLIKAEEECHGR